MNILNVNECRYLLDKLKKAALTDWMYFENKKKNKF